jgi:hypothetical protein
MADAPLDRFTEVHRGIAGAISRYAPLTGGSTPIVRGVNIVDTTDPTDLALSKLLDTLQEADCPRIEIVQGAWNNPQPILPTERKCLIHATYVIWLTTNRVRVQQLNRVKQGIIGAMATADRADESRPSRYMPRGIFGLPYINSWQINAADRVSGDIAIGPQQAIVRGGLCASSVLSVTFAWAWAFGDFVGMSL